MKLKIYCAALFAIGLSLAAYAFSPFTSSPDAVTIDVAKGEKCVKETGRLKCRWDGPCVQVGNQCMSCLKDQLYSQEMGQCYSCPKGTSLRRENNSWTCK